MIFHWEKTLARKRKDQLLQRVLHLYPDFSASGNINIHLSSLKVFHRLFIKKGILISSLGFWTLKEKSSAIVYIFLLRQHLEPLLCCFKCRCWVDSRKPSWWAIFKRKNISITLQRRSFICQNIRKRSEPSVSLGQNQPGGLLKTIHAAVLRFKLLWIGNKQWRH